MGGIAEEGDRAVVLPGVRGRQRVEGPVDVGSVVLGDQPLQVRGPGGVLVPKVGTQPLGVGGAQPGLRDPVGGGLLDDVDADVAAAVALCEQAPVAVAGVGAAVADECADLGVAVLHVVEPGFEERHAGVGGKRLRDGLADVRPRSVGSYDQVGLDAGSVVEPHRARPIRFAVHALDRPSPLHRARLEGVQQQVAELTAIDLWLETVVRFGELVHEQLPGRGVLPHLLPFRTGPLEELLQQPRLAQRDLTVVGVQVETPALVARVAVRVTVVDRHAEAVTLQDAGARQTPRPRAHDADTRVSDGRGE